MALIVEQHERGCRQGEECEEIREFPMSMEYIGGERDRNEKVCGAAHDSLGQRET
jgi:hypothetical protein